MRLLKNYFGLKKAEEKKMNKNMIPYYLSRTIISVAFGLLLFVTGLPLWNAMLIGGIILALFLWAPHSGRYSVHPEFGITALRRDERTQTINDKAARNAFIVSMLTIGAIAVYFGSFGAINISVGIFKIVLAIGALTYFVSDLWLRKSHQ
jgi:heme O synthase-like polyprenyltransferase